MRVREHAVHDALVDAGLPQPLRGEVRVALGIVGRLVLVQVVEQAGQGPRLLVLAEVTAQPAHDPLDADQVAVRDVLVDLRPSERPCFDDVHAAPSL